MAILSIPVAPQSRVAPERRGAVMGKFCHGCATAFPLHAGRHVGKGINGRDHVASPCAHEGELFETGASWWEPAVEVLPPVPVAAPVAPAAKTA